MRRVTLVLEHHVDGLPLKEVPFKAIQQRLNQAIPAARWAYLGYLGNRFCLDTVVTDQRLESLRQQARRVDFVRRVLDEPWPAGHG